MKQSVYNDNAIGIVNETRAMRTHRAKRRARFGNIIWSKGRVECIKLTVLCVNLRNLRLKFLYIFCGLCAICGCNSLFGRNLVLSGLRGKLRFRANNGYVFQKNGTKTDTISKNFIYFRVTSHKSRVTNSWLTMAKFG